MLCCLAPLSAQSSRPASRPLATLFGDVVDVTGQPAADADVQLLRWPLETLPPVLRYGLPNEPVVVARTRTRADGRFEFPAEAGRLYGLVAQRGNDASRPVAERMAGDATRLEIAPARVLAGTVRRRSAAGAITPAARAHVRLVTDAVRTRRELLPNDLAQRMPFVFATECNGDGTFELRWRAATEPTEITVVHADRAFHPAVDPSRPRIDLTLDDGPVVSGVVLRKGDRAPVAGAILAPAGWPQTWRTDAHGRFEVPAERAFTVRAPGGRMLPLPTPRGDAPVEVLVEDGLAVRARLVGADRRPLARARIVCFAPRKSAANPQLMVSAPWIEQTDDDGRLAIDGLWPEQSLYLFADLAGDFVPIAALSSVSEDTDLKDVMARADAGLVGQAFTASGTPAGETVVSLMPLLPGLEAGNVGPSLRREALTDRLGRFVLRGLLPCEYRLAIVSDRDGACLKRVEARAPETLVRLALTAPQFIAGQVLDAAGAPAADAFVTIGEQPGAARAPIPDLSAVGLVWRQVRTGADGRFRANTALLTAPLLISAQHHVGTRTHTGMAANLEPDAQGVEVQLGK